MAIIREYNGITIAYADIDKSAIEQIMNMPQAGWYEPYLSARRTIKRQLEFANAVMLLSHILPQAPHICYNDDGKPYLTDSPYKISISHSKHYIAVAASCQHNVGIDTEPVSFRILNLAERFMTEHEYDTFKSIDNGSTPLPYTAAQYATMVWCAKEAVYKIAGEAAFDYQKAQEIILSPTDNYAIINPNRQRIELKVIDSADDNIILVAYD